MLMQLLAFPWGDASLVRQLLCFLHADDVQRLCASHRAVLERVLPVLRQHQQNVGRLALALWLQQRLRVDFQARYQVLETQRIARSHSRDPRVPPRVVPFWSERGEVEGGKVALKPSALPFVHADGFTARFAVDPSAKPMLTNVVQTQRRIYTTVTVKVVTRDGEPSASATRTDTGNGGDEGSAIILRQYTYVKEFGEWTAPTLPEKRQFSMQSDAPCRFDLLSRDGSVVLELDVPAGTDSMVDYYLVKKAVVSIHLAELLQHFFRSIRPPRPLPAAATLQAECVISLHFRTLGGKRRVSSLTLPGHIIIERQQPALATENSSSSTTPAISTGIEHFDVITCKPSAASTTNTPIAELPKDPGYLWLRVWDAECKQIYFHATILHQGALTTLGVAVLHAEWLPGVLEFYPTLDSRQRRCLKGHVTISSAVDSGALQNLSIVAQHIERSRLERYAASISSYTRIEH